MDKAKHKHGELNTRFYWRIFLPLALILLFCLRFPIRITLPDLYDDILIYSSISLASFLTAIWIYRRSKWVYRQILVVILLCGILAGWQVIDLSLRYPQLPPYAPYFHFSFYQPYMGQAEYFPRYRNPELACDTIYEYYIGTRLLAITTASSRGENGRCIP